MSAKKFVQLLEEKGLLDGSSLNDIRQQVAERKVSAANIAKALVDKGVLTKYQATQLVGEATADSNSGVELDEKTDADDVVMLEEAAPVAGLTPVEDAGAALTPVAAAPVAAVQGGLEPLEDLQALDGGGLEPLGPPDAGGGLDPFEAQPKPTGSPKKPDSAKPPRAKKNHQDWGGKLMIGGGGLLLFLILGGLLLYKSVFGQPAIELFNNAEESYKSESFSQALADYQKFLEKFPSDENADEARVRVVLCRIRTSLADPQKAYDTSMELIPTVNKEESFPGYRDEFPGILPKIVQGFIRKANGAADRDTKEEFIGKSELALKDLVNNPALIPASKRPAIETELKRIDEDIANLKRTVAKDRELVKALDSIKAHVAAGETIEAYKVYNALLNVYPSVREDESLRTEVRTITDAEKARVQVTMEDIPGSTEDHKSPSVYQVVLATRSGKPITRLENQAVAVLAGGSVYGIDAGTGAVLWRRFVGYHTRHQPAPVTNQPGADLILSDSQRQEVVRVKAASGKMVWRAAIGAAFGAPAVAGDSIFVTAENGAEEGKIIRLDAATGDSSLQVSVPQRLQIAAGVSQSHPYLLQPGLHSNLYAISSQTLECNDVEYLGHKKGTIAVPPLVIQDHVLIAENASPSTCRLHIRKIVPDTDGPLFQRTQDPILLKGNVIVPMLLYGRRPLVVTDIGEINVFNVDFNRDSDTVEHAATPNAPRQERMKSYPVVEGTTLVVVDDKLVKYELQITRKLVRQDSVTNSSETFIGPPVLLGDILIVTRRLRGSTGATVSALQVDQPRNAIWRTHLSVPISRAAVVPDDKRLDVVTAVGSLFEVNIQTLQAGYSSDPAVDANVVGALSFTDQVVFGDGKVAYFNPVDNGRALMQTPGAGSGRLRLVTLNLQNAKVTCTPLAFKGGLLAPTDNGVIVLADTNTGGNMVLPFQPKLGPGENVQWRRPAAVGDEFIAVDDRQNIYRVGINPKPQPFLEASATGKLEVNIDSALAAIGDTVYGVVKNSGGDVVVAINATDLSVTKEIPLEGHVTWGPVQVDDSVFCLSDTDGLLCFGPGGEQRWKTVSGFEGDPAGEPLRVDADYVFALLDGTVVRLSAETGEKVSTAHVGEPLGAGPVAFGKYLLLPGHDGVLHLIVPPQSAG